jgi:hypothetical protein
MAVNINMLLLTDQWEHVLELRAQSQPIRALQRMFMLSHPFGHIKISCRQSKQILQTLLRVLIKFCEFVAGITHLPACHEIAQLSSALWRYALREMASSSNGDSSRKVALITGITGQVICFLSFPIEWKF